MFGHHTALCWSEDYLHIQIYRLKNTFSPKYTHVERPNRMQRVSCVVVRTQSRSPAVVLSYRRVSYIICRLCRVYRLLDILYPMSLNWHVRYRISSLLFADDTIIFELILSLFGCFDGISVSDRVDIFLVLGGLVILICTILHCVSREYNIGGWKAYWS